MTQISRRGVVKVAAWSVPAIAVAVSSPAYATSLKPSPKPMYTKAWKEPGNGQFPKKGSFIAFSADTADYIGAVTINGVAASKVYVEKRKAYAWGIDQQPNSKTPLNVKVTTVDGVVHDLGTIHFLPWSAATKK